MALFLLLATGCALAQEPQKLRVVATTTVVGDVVRAVGGDAIDLTTLMPLDGDPHTFEPTPRDVIAVSRAGLLFYNGAGLETYLDRLLANAGGAAKPVDLSSGLPLLRWEGHEEEEEAGHHHGETDPHVWFDPRNVMQWARTIEQALSKADPAHAATYEANAERYEQQLADLDAWIKKQVDLVPPARRLLVADHATLGYFARAYGFAQSGSVIEGFSTLAEPSARELADLEETMRGLEIPAVFLSRNVNPTLAQRVTEDTGTRLVPFYSGSLGAPGGPADSYVSFMKFNVSAIVEALK